jgi:KaiC/GvpD/RAD55 family RecA-like ATPase
MISMSVALKRVSSGIESLDAMTSGGIPESTVTLVYGPPKVGKSVFVYHFLAQSVKNSEACIVIATDYEGKELVHAMGAFGWAINDALKAGSIRLVSMVPAQVARSTGNGDSRDIVSLANPTDLMIWLGGILRAFSESKVKFRIVWDSLTPLFIYNPPMLVAKVIREFGTRIRRSEAVGAIVTLDQGSIDAQSETILKASVDNVVRLSSEGMLQIEGMLGTARAAAAYDITSSGMVVKSK